LISYVTHKENFSTLVLRELCGSVFSPRLSDPIRMFVVPALAEFKDFPYIQLIACINRLQLEPTINLLYCVLSLDSSNQYCKYKQKNSINIITLILKQMRVDKMFHSAFLITLFQHSFYVRINYTYVYIFIYVIFLYSTK